MNPLDLRGIEQGLLRTVSFFDTMDYAPTWIEACTWGEFGVRDIEQGLQGYELSAPRPVPSAQELEEAKRALLADGVIEEGFGRVALKGRLAPLCTLVYERTPLFPRKLRVARRVARWLSRHPAVRFVALANTTSLAHARDHGDLDFFVVVKDGYIWSARLWGSGLYKLLGRLPGATERPDDVCLSYFISDAGLDLSSHMLTDGDDPYFRYWFLALLPLYDDGVSADLWNANRFILTRHPRAERWIPSQDLSRQTPWLRLPDVSRIEPQAKQFQLRWFPASIRDRIGRGTEVIVSDQALKFHVDDARMRYRDQHQQRLTNLGIL